MDEIKRPYYDYTISPLGRLFYRSVWEQLGTQSGKDILDFGSGFGFTAGELARDNRVTAIDPDPGMIQYATASGYTQLIGDVRVLSSFADAAFDLIVCHMVLEFVPNREEVLAELTRLLKPGGLLSIVKHNRNGRIIQAIVQDYALAEAKELLEGNPSHSGTFGPICYYEDEDLLRWAKHTLRIRDKYAVRALASLHDAARQSEEACWVDEMLEMEHRLQSRPDYMNIAYFHHLLLTRA